MARGDYAKIKSEIGGVLSEDVVRVTTAGGRLAVDLPKRDAPWLSVQLLGRTGKTNRSYTYALSAVRSIEVFEKDAD